MDKDILAEDGMVSIVVPVYNCEAYLPDCVQSILGQTYDNIELLLVDDGSTDQSGRLCDQYSDNSRVQVFHQDNAGVSCARNFGIAAASGTYIMFVDGDDTIEETMVETLVRALHEAEADCAFCGLVHDHADDSRCFPEHSIKKVTDGREAVREVLINYIATAGPVCKLFRKDLLLTEGKAGSFPVDLTIGEDAVAVVGALQRAGKVAFDTKPLYHYNHREESLMSSPYSERDNDLITAYERIGEALMGQGLEKEIIFRQIWAHFHVYDKMIRSGCPDLAGEKKLLRWFRGHIVTILKNPYVGRMRKLSMCMLFINKRLYRGIIRRRSL